MYRTHKLGLAVLALSLAACSDTAVTPVASVAAPNHAPLHAASPGRGVDGRYIVVLNEGANARGVAAAIGANPRDVYTSVLNGFSADLNVGQLNMARHHPAVAYVEQDQTTRAAVTQTSAPWGLDRIDQRSLPLSTTYTYNVSGSGVSVYILDTGIETSHPQLIPAQNVYDAFGGNGEDCNGHGTHIAGIIGSTAYGAAKGSALRGVRVLDCLGQGTVAAAIAATDWVRLNRVSPAVANLSFTAPLSAAFNTAVNNLAGSGMVFVTVAAGDGNVNACTLSPASASSAITVAASSSTDVRASWSNYGSCVDLYAPGVNITSTWLGGTTATASGTSQAAAYAAGAGALYKGQYGNPVTSGIHSWFVTNATTNVISGNPVGTPNRLLWKGAL